MTADDINRGDLDATVARVGSEHSISIAELAEAVGRVMGCGHRILGRPYPGWNPGRYVPAMGRVTAEFGPL